jgi:hypothetical protein
MNLDCDVWADIEFAGFKDKGRSGRSAKYGARY